MKGPYPIVCRAHSGGRLLSEIYERNGVQMGNLHPTTKDTTYFAARKNFAIRNVIRNSNSYLMEGFKGKRHLQNLIKGCIEKYIYNEIYNHTEPFGWKFGETLFTLPVVFDLYPHTRAVHLIRDGRDVMLSRIDARFDSEKFHEKFNKLIVLGDSNIDDYMGEYINAGIINKYRAELEFMHWNTVVNYGKKLRCYTKQYMEIKYEDLCLYPIDTLERIFSFINVPLSHSVLSWVEKKVTTDRIGKWKILPKEYLNNTIEIGKQNLSELGYLL